MINENESFSTPQESWNLIRKVAATIKPDDEYLSDWFLLFTRNHSARLAFDLECVKANTGKDQRIIEYGAVPLLLTGALKEEGYDVVALDLNPDKYAIAANKLGIEIRQCDIEREVVPFDDEEFDVVLFNELFEHLRINLIFTMKEVYRILKPGGFMLLSTPNLRSLGGIRNLILRDQSYSCMGDIYRQYETLDKLGFMGHVREYTVSEVADFLGKIGFQVTKVIRRGRYHRFVSQTLVHVLPSLRPFFSIVATKK